MACGTGRNLPSEHRGRPREPSFRIAVQTTSYGALPPEDILQVAQGLMTAAQLAKVMSAEIQLAGYRVIGG